MNILLTGGAGYIGSACLRWLIKQGHNPIAFDNLSEGNAAAVPDGRLYKGDLLNKEALMEAMQTYDIEAVMHFAAVASVPESISQPDLYWQINVIGTKNVLDAMRENGICKILFSSTAATYSFECAMPIHEDSQQLPKVPYGTTKLAAEWMIKDYAKAYDFGYGILRYFNASGADPDGEFGEDRRSESHIIPLVLHTAIGRRDKFCIFGGDWDTRDGTCVRDFIHTEDLAQAHQRAVEAIEVGEQRVYTCGSGTGTTVLEVVRACEKAVGHAIPHEIVERRTGDPGVLVATPRRLEEELGWEPRYTEIEEIAETAWRWHQRYPKGYESKRDGTPV